MLFNRTAVSGKPKGFIKKELAVHREKLELHLELILKDMARNTDF